MIFAVIAIAGWSYFNKDSSSTNIEQVESAESFNESAPKINRATENFACDGRQYCSQMRSRSEAEYFLKNCPDTKMDGDRDGIPCENDSRL